MTKQEAIDFAEAGKWKPMSHEYRARLQLNEQFLCMPFSEFHEAIEKTLKRPVWTHEFADRQRLLRELATLDATGDARENPLEDALEMLDPAKTVIVATDDPTPTSGTGGE